MRSHFPLDSEVLFGHPFLETPSLPLADNQTLLSPVVNLSNLSIIPFSSEEKVVISVSMTPRFYSLKQMGRR